MVKKSILLTGALFLSACSNKVGTSIQESVINNQKAASQKQWVESGRHPEALFSDWRSEYASGDTKAQSELAELVCSELLQLDELSLTLFEEELNKKENEVIVNACQAELLDRIERYFVRQRKSMRVPLQTVQQRASFTFGKNIQTRDLSNGYYAINGDLKPKEVILTFDDGPVANYTQSIVNSLDQVNAKAIFFHLGKNVRLNPDLVKRLAKSGHTVGSHSVTHPCLGGSSSCRRANGRVYSYSQAVSEIQGGHQAVYDVLGWVDPFFRFPYGESSPELKNYLRQAQVAEFFWSIDSEDWKATSNRQLLDKVWAQLDARGRGVILFHDIQRRTAEIMPQFLSELYYKGYSVVQIQPADPEARYKSKIVRRNKP